VKNLNSIQVKLYCTTRCITKKNVLWAKILIVMLP